MSAIRQAVIPVAGLGTRLLPITKAVPKELLPLLDRPVLHYIVEETVRSGIHDVIFVTAAGKSAIEDYFDRDPRLESFLHSRGKADLLRKVIEPAVMIEVASVRQKEPLGLGHAIGCATPLLEGEPFAVLLGDDLVDAQVPAIQQIVEVYQEKQAAVIGLMQVPQNQVDQYGIIEGREERPGLYRLTNMIEKPKLDEAPSNLAIVGRYVLTPQVGQLLSSQKPGRGNEIQLTDTLQRLLENEAVYGCLLEGRRFDAGDLGDLLKANLVFALRDRELRRKLLPFLRDLIT